MHIWLAQYFGTDSDATAAWLRWIIGFAVALYGGHVGARSILWWHWWRRKYPPKRLWTGSVLSRTAYGRRRYDAVVCIGVMPHIPEKSDGRVLRNIHGALKRNGLAVVEARNQFFSLFTLNRYSYEFFVNDLIPAKMKPKARRLRRRFRMDLPPVRKGYDEILSRTHNPLVLRDRFVRAGFKDVRLHFYHYHALPPMLERESPGAFRRASQAMEDPDDWRGYFMASAFLVTGRRA